MCLISRQVRSKSRPSIQACQSPGKQDARNLNFLHTCSYTRVFRSNDLPIAAGNTDRLPRVLATRLQTLTSLAGATSLPGESPEGPRRSLPLLRR